MRKRHIALLAATAATALLVTSCAAEGGDPAAKPEGTPSGEITYAIWSNSQKPTMEKLIADFNTQYPDVTVNLEVTPWDQYFTKLQTQASSGTLPDVFWMNRSNVQLYALNGMLQPIDDMVVEEPIDLGNYPQQLVDLFTVEGVSYGVPKDFDSIAIFYNKDIFDRAGVDYPNPDWTLDEFKTSAAAITDALKDEGVYGVAMVFEGQSTFYNTIFQKGGFVISEDGRASGYDDPKTQAGIQFWVDVIQEGISPSVAQLTDSPGDEWFTAGRAAMYQGGNFDIKNIMSSDVAEHVQVVRLPKDEKSATIFNGLGNVVSHNTDNKLAADAFLAYLGSQQAALIQSAAGTAASAFNGTQGPWLASQPTLDLNVFMDSGQEFGVLFPGSVNTLAWNQLENEFLGEIWTGDVSVEEGTSALAARMNELLEKE